ncbi:hypothetical protein [Oceanobacillus senegalensis]|uniref:hypothetical protein n=1 Tax=Oceanobacillus senegalensis TaxID=1936063 RepID=UPI001FE89C97|nr:hypothetical protein [Oceanobacillus senegalensis]
MQEFLPAIQKLNPSQPLTRNDLLVDEFLMGKEEELHMYYAPHNEYVNKTAIIVIVGITPGWNQMKMAFAQLLRSLDCLHITDQILEEVKKAASFSGSMRSNLIQMLDECGVHEVVHVNSSSALFEKYRKLVHTTSIIKYPVFYQGKNYNGHRPSIQQSALLSKYAFHVFPKELNQIKQSALIIPLGKTVEDVFKKLLKEDKLSKHYYLFGFPHPSGANGHRKKQFHQRKELLTSTIREWAQHLNLSQVKGQ